MDDKTIAFLEQNKLFLNFTPNQLTYFKNAATEIMLPQGNTLITEGDKPDNFYILKEGSIEIVKKDKQGIEYTVAILNSGDIVGETGLLTNKNRCASARAETDCVLLVFSIKDFQQDANKELYLILIKNISEVLAKRLNYAYSDTVDNLRISMHKSEKIHILQRAALIVLVFFLIQLGGMFYYFFYSKSFCQTINSINNEITDVSQKPAL